MTAQEVLDGPAIVWCDGAFDTPEGKTAHGLVRFTYRYQVLSVIDRRHAGRDAAEVLDGTPKGIPVVPDLAAALADAAKRGIRPTCFVIGMAPDGGRLPDDGRATVRAAIEAGLNVDCGLHDFLSEDPVIAGLAAQKGVRIRDVRKPPHRKDLHHFSGRIEEVMSLKIAVLGTDSAVGKRTTAWILVHGLQQAGYRAEMVGTGQTAWMQGAKHGIVLDSLINDFLSGEIEHAVWSAWQDGKPDVIVIEGQGSLMNPAYPGGFEILAAGRPDIIIMQHAPARLEYDGFPGYPLHPLSLQIQVAEQLSGKPVAAVTVNHEAMPREQVPMVCDTIHKITGRPTFDVLRDGPEGLVEALKRYIKPVKR